MKIPTAIFTHLGVVVILAIVLLLIPGIVLIVLGTRQAKSQKSSDNKAQHGKALPIIGYIFLALFSFTGVFIYTTAHVQTKSLYSHTIKVTDGDFDDLQYIGYQNGAHYFLDTNSKHQTFYSTPIVHMNSVGNKSVYIDYSLKRLDSKYSASKEFPATSGVKIQSVYVSFANDSRNAALSRLNRYQNTSAFKHAKRLETYIKYADTQN